MQALVLRKDKIKVIDAYHPLGCVERIDITIRFNNKTYKGLLEMKE